MSNNKSERLEAMWGTPILDDGFSNIPNMLIRNYRRVGLSHGEFCFILTILTYKHDVNNPFPSQQKIADHMGVTRRQVVKWLDSIHEKGLVIVGQRLDSNSKFQNNVYDFKPLIDKVLQLLGEAALPSNKQDGTIRYRAKKEKIPCEPQVHTASEPQVHTASEPEVHTASEPQVHTKKKREKENNKKKIINHHLFDELNEKEKNRLLDFLLDLKIDDDEIINNFITRIYNFPTKVSSSYKKYYKQVLDSVIETREEPIKKVKEVKNRFVSNYPEEETKVNAVEDNIKTKLNDRLKSIKVNKK